MMKKENTVLGSLYSNSDSMGCTVSPFLCLILSHENDVILAQVDNRRLWRHKRIKKGKRRKETERDTGWQPAKNRRKGLLTQLQTCHSIVVRLFTLLLSFHLLFYLESISFYLLYDISTGYVVLQGKRRHEDNSKVPFLYVLSTITHLIP